MVRRRLGAGNFATVYLAHDERLDVPVAVKLLSDRWSWEPEVRGRFVQEARLLRSINDAAVVQIRDIAETDDGRPYLVMDLATEGTLEQRLARLAHEGSRASTADLRLLVDQLAASLSVLHARRITHRDLKPSNILVTADPRRPADSAAAAGVLRPGERLMLGDLGLAKDLGVDSGVTVGVGTAGYMAPEQALPGGRIDTRVDIYAASALVAEVASGERPDPLRRYSGGRVASGRPLPESIPGPLRAALARGLETDPADRQQTVEEWHAEVTAGLDALEATGGRADTARSPAGRWRVPVVAGVLAVAAGGTALVLTTGADGGDAGRGTTATTTTADAASTEVSTTVAGPFVRLLGPTTFARGEPVVWTVEHDGVVGGTWSLTGPVQPDPAEWVPGNWFRGTWNVVGTFTLRLDARDAGGAVVSDSITFTVT